LYGRASELAKYNINLLEIQEVGWVEGGGQPADDYTHLSM